MANGDIIPDEGRIPPSRHMDDATILNIAPFTDANVVDIATQDRVIPNAGICSDLGIANDLSSWSYKNTRINLRLYSTVGMNRHVSP